MSEVSPPAFETRQCAAKNLDQVIATQIQDGKLGAAQKMFNDCITTRALQAATKNQEAESPQLAQNIADKPPGKAQDSSDTERTDGMLAGRAVWQTPQLVSQAIDELKYEVRKDLTKAKFAHPEYADMLDGVAIDDK